MGEVKKRGEAEEKDIGTGQLELRRLYYVQFFCTQYNCFLFFIFIIVVVVFKLKLD